MPTSSPQSSPTSLGMALPPPSRHRMRTGARLWLQVLSRCVPLLLATCGTSAQWERAQDLVFVVSCMRSIAGDRGRCGRAAQFDEDPCATSSLIRDRRMERLVFAGTATPRLQGVRVMLKGHDFSSGLVIGGCVTSIRRWWY
ncbi:hypothetical protein C8Q70DRAFT_184470 [Cubamyces menziesii]|nr:hypothetical protein C8Q70DRAFT_184470 [Cubamyces menziesii]